MDAKDKVRLEEMASDLIRALKFGDVETALQFFHPDDRAKAERDIRESIKTSIDDLPVGDPVFEWSQTSKGTPCLELLNSNTQWGMAWFCCFRDGKWWLS